jgi:hypothetical protein
VGSALRRIGRDRAALIAGLLAPLALSVLLVPWRNSLPNTDAALVLVALVVAVAANGHRGAGLLAAVSAAVWFDFFLTEPYERFTITRHTDAETTVLLLLVGALVTEIAARSRHHHRHSLAESAYVDALHTTAEMVASGRPATAVVEQVSAYLTATLALRGCRYEEASFLGRAPRLQPDGHIAWGDARWDVDRLGLPQTGEIELPVRANGRTVGRFMLAGRQGVAPSLEARRVAVVLADLLGAHLAGAYQPSNASNASRI